ncbi:pyridoxal phosphate-dependent transferase [Trichoderma chlorosporum]
MGSYEPEDYIKTLASISAQVRDATGQLPHFSDLNHDEASSIHGPAGEEDLARIRKLAVPTQTRTVEEVISEMNDIYSFRTRVGHPRFLSAVPSVATPASWLGDSIASAFNAFSGVWLAGPGIATVEVELIAWLAAQVGLPSSAGGIFVSGGSVANLTAMTAARDQRLKQDDRSKGIIYFSDQTHFCVPKALRILGFFDYQMRKIPSDKNFYMDVAKLEETIIADKSQGLVPFLVIANCGTTNTGAIDPLDEIADLAHEHNLWMHADGAYGASVALSGQYRSLVAGLKRADSIAWDAHKWLFQTFGCAITLVRDKRHLAESFTLSAEYLQDHVSGDDQPNLFNYGIELTRPARHMRLWFSLRVLGVDTMAQMIDHGFLVAAAAEAKLATLQHWKITSPARLSTITFRFCPEGMDERIADQLNGIISRDALQQNITMIHTTQIHGQTSLRICSINPLTTVACMEQIIEQLHAIACKSALGL